MAAITNASVDYVLTTLASSWFGPGTRVTNVESPQLQNTNDFTFTVPHGDGDTTSVVMTYDELISEFDRKPIIFHAVIRDIAAGYDAPYGPLTVITTEAELSNGNSAFEQPITFKLASPYLVEFELPYDKAKHESYLQSAVKRAAGYQLLVNDLKTAIGTLKTYADTLTAPHTIAEQNELVERIFALSEQAGHLARL